MAVTDNTTWVILGGLILGLGLLMLFSTPSQPLADAAPMAALAVTDEVPETLIAKGQGQEAIVVAGSLPRSEAAPPPEALRRATSAPCDCEPARPTCPAFDSYRAAVRTTTRSTTDPCEPPQPPCDDPCTPHVRPPDPYVPQACICNPCWNSAETDGLCDRPTREPSTIPHPFWPEAERPCRPATAPTPLIDRSYEEWVVEGGRVQLHGRVSNPHYLSVCFQWSADRGTFEDPTSLDPIYIAPPAERWGDSVCITLTTFDSCGGRRYDQIRLRVNPRL